MSNILPSDDTVFPFNNIGFTTDKVADKNIDSGQVGICFTCDNSPISIGKSITANQLQIMKDSPKEPEGDVKKKYDVGCYDGDGWKYVHEILMKDGTLEDNIPSEKIECSDEVLGGKRRGTYLLTPTEAEELKKHPKVKFVNISTHNYRGTYMEVIHRDYDLTD